MEMDQQEVLLKDYSDEEKGAYLGAIASMATADHQATEEEMEYIMALADAAELSEQQKQAVRHAAKELTGEDLKKCLDLLKNSKLKFSLITDLISFAKSDNNYSDEEKANIQKISKYLGINEQQFSFLDQFVNKAGQTENAHQQVNQPEFLASSGLSQSAKSSGIDIGSLTKGFLGVIGPMVLAGLAARGMRGRGGGGLGGMMGGGGIGGMLGGMLGGGGPGGMFGGTGRSGGMMGGGGGLGSLIGALSGGRGYSRTGGMLGKMMGF
jgi:uncharacterized tellurite resistance protein B-like protein